MSFVSQEAPSVHRLQDFVYSLDVQATLSRAYSDVGCACCEWHWGPTIPAIVYFQWPRLACDALSFPDSPSSEQGWGVKVGVNRRDLQHPDSHWHTHIHKSPAPCLSYKENLEDTHTHTHLLVSIPLFPLITPVQVQYLLSSQPISSNLLHETTVHHLWLEYAAAYWFWDEHMSAQTWTTESSLSRDEAENKWLLTFALLHVLPRTCRKTIACVTPLHHDSWAWYRKVSFLSKSIPPHFILLSHHLQTPLTALHTAPRQRH